MATTVTSVTVSATKSDPNAVLTGSLTAGAGVATGQATMALGGPGTATPVTITVTAPNGSAKTYNITVNRLSNDNNLSALSVTPGFLDPAFAANTLSYTVNVAIDVAEVTVTATKSDPNAVLSGSITDPGAGQATGQATIPLGGPGTATPVSITVTSPNGSSKTYAITVNRAAPSSDNNLSALSVTPGSLDPAFAASTLLYMVNVATDVTEVTVTATKSDPNAVLSGSVADPGAGQATGQATIPLNGAGTPTSISITVTAPSGASQTYTVTVNRAAPSSDANLSALTVTGGSLVPDFTPNTTIYTLDVPFSVDSVTVSATKSDPNAVMSGDLTAGTGVPAGQGTFPLIPLVPRPVSITVTAPNGDSKIYSVTITRALF
ncbi:MAG: cadherin-like beta sandwich domain-containing protein [Nitrospirae bacterium]|nr:cadherin-like beta sandwich domain-containing protein [Nitrospirota bacterium]